MSHPNAMLDICVYQDVLCPWSYVLDARLDCLKAELGPWALWRTRAFPLWLKDAALSERAIKTAVEEIQRAAAEPEGKLLSTELWRSAQRPRSSVPALVALEAAKLQGDHRYKDLARAMQRAALIEGVDVTRTDAVLELAARAGLEMSRFSASFQSPGLRKLVLQEHRLARKRGVSGVPTLVVNGRWMISGLRDLSEYRELLLSCLKNASDKTGEGERMIH